ncbi:WD40/YVTN repeat-like-containing domain [Raphanus sativus]|nr:WD40/YVTN repeat-like-containing domain [Raphanus sativus]
MFSSVVVLQDLICRLKNSWFCHDNIVTCSRDGSAIIWIPRSRRSHFYLGDYRPLIQDIYGNVLDQESQLPPYRRNMEEPLCDSVRIPYEEPYQTMFQKRRLGALGKEWRPSSLKLCYRARYHFRSRLPNARSRLIS